MVPETFSRRSFREMHGKGKSRASKVPSDNNESWKGEKSTNFIIILTLIRPER